jgi:hypothetical protein
MNIYVTIGARSADHLRYTPPPLGSKCQTASLDNVEGNMALSAQPDLGSFQEAGICAAVGLMAIGAILRDGRVLKDDRTSVPGVARIAQLVCRKAFHQLL